MLNNGIGMVYQVLNNRIEYCGRRSQLFTKLKTKLCFNFVAGRGHKTFRSDKKKKKKKKSWVFWMHYRISTHLLSDSPEAWEGAILFSDVFIHGSDILNNLCVPAELQSKLIFYHIP